MAGEPRQTIMKFSQDKYHLTTTLTKNEILSILRDRTLKKMSLISEKTDKDFIGQINETSFSIIDSAFSIGAACVINGHIDNSNIHINTKLHHGFRILFWFWFIAILGVNSFFSFKNFSLLNYLGTTLAIIIGAVVFRSVFHLVYLRSRNQAIAKLNRLLKVSN